MAIWSYWVHNFVYITSPSLYCRLHNGYCNLTYVKIDYRHTTSVTGLLDELGWLFKCCKHSRLTALHNLSAISLDHLSVSSWHTRASSEKKFMSLPVRTDVFKHSFFPRTITHWNSLPLAVRLLQSIQSFHGFCWTRHPPAIADHHDTPAVMGGLHPLLDISLKNWRIYPSELSTGIFFMWYGVFCGWVKSCPGGKYPWIWQQSIYVVIVLQLFNLHRFNLLCLCKLVSRSV